MKKLNLKTKFIFIIWLFLTTLWVSFANILTLADDFLVSFWTWIQEKYAETLFNNNWSYFWWVFFIDWVVYNTWEMTLTWTSNTKLCRQQIKWLYYNPQRWWFLFPLDKSSLDLLKWIDSGYNNMTFTWGFFMDCSWSNSKNIFWQIKHTVNWNTYRLVAWVKFSWNDYLQEFGENLFYKNEVLSWIFWDSWWWKASVFGTWIPDSVPDSFSFPVIKNTDLNKFYKSEPVTVLWIDPIISLPIKITNWILYINWQFKWTTWTVKLWDKVQIELKSSSDYNSITSSQVEMWIMSASFYVITKSSDYEQKIIELSIVQKFMIMTTFKDIMAKYEWSDKLVTFLYTFKSMLKDEIDLIENEEKKAMLEYLYEVMEWYIMSLSNTQTDKDIYTAPNCKRYDIVYDESRLAYTSSSFVVKKYFATLALLKDYINKSNPWNWKCDSVSNYNNSDADRRVAPNWKVYKIAKTDRWYTSYDFINIKFFDSLTAIRSYIDYNNPVKKVRNHTIDKSFEPEVYTAPSWKIYKIYKTDVWFMAYEFLNVKYFPTLISIKNYINKNNPSK